MAKRPEISSAPLHPLADGIRGLHHTLISTANQRAVLMLVATTPGITNAEIARRSGLGAQTVSRFLTDLEQERLIRRGNVKRGQPGLPATPYYLNHENVVSLGVSIGWRRCDVVLMDMSGSPRLAESIHYEHPDAETVVPGVARLWQRISRSSEITGQERLLIGGVAVPEDTAGDLHLPGRPDHVDSSWLDAGVAKRLTDATGLPFRRYGLGRAAAWAEHAGPGSPWEGHFLHLYIDDVISSGVIVGGAAWRSGTAGILDPRIGRTLAGGRGGQPTRLQDIASVAALRRHVRDGGISPTADDEAENLFSAPAAEAWMEETAGALAWAFANTAMMIGMRHAVLGGSMPRPVLTRLCEAVRERLHAIWPCDCEPVSVGVGLAGSAAPAIGASYLPVYEELFSRESTA